MVGLGEIAVGGGERQRRGDDQDEPRELFAALNVALIVGHAFL